ncbi:MAG: hypothetical protein H0T11_09030, partial [Chthoniobacterales bacterium]|nr:hypothetical protein [Chthoniobacterales bacterium]
MTPIVLAGALVLVAPVRRAVTTLVSRARGVSGRQTLIVALVFGVISALAIAAAAVARGEAVFPQSHDELAYVVQTHILAGARLLMPMHTQGDFFESFFLCLEPVYAPIYFPGTALVFTPMVWLGLPYWLLPMLLASTAVA